MSEQHCVKEQTTYLGAAVDDLQKQIAEMRAYFGKAIEDLEARIKALEDGRETDEE